MDRRSFLKRTTAIAIGVSLADRISALESWHQAYPSGVALAEAPRGGATLATLDSVLRDYYLPVIQEQLNQECLHRCGHRYTVGWTERDGQILRWAQHVDAWDAYLYARCDHCRRQVRHPSNWYFAKLRITGTAVYGHRSFLSALGFELDAMTRELIGRMKYDRTQRWPASHYTVQ